jgi:hypothetical protein
VWMKSFRKRKVVLLRNGPLPSTAAVEVDPWVQAD